MDLPRDDAAAVSDSPNPVEEPLTLPSGVRYDVGLVLLTGVTGVLGGIAVTLIFVGSLSPEALALFAFLVVVAGITLVMLVRQRNVYQAKAVQEWEAARRSEHAALQALINTLKKEARDDEPPQIFGWQALGLEETEIAPQLSILAALFKGQRQVRILTRFDGGHRNRGVYLVRASAEADRVVKIARSADIRAERDAQTLINRFSQNNGGQLVRDVIGADADAPGGIVYRLASLRRASDVRTFGAYYRESQNAHDCALIVEQLYSEILPHSQFREVYVGTPFQEYAIPERVVNDVWNVLQGIEAFATIKAEAEWLEFDTPELRRVRNPLVWVRTIMPRHQTLQMEMVRGVIHGDLHSGNLLIQLPGPNVWIIDFAKARADAPTLVDYARLEADVKFHLLEGTDAADYLAQALRFEEHWAAARFKNEVDAAPPDISSYPPEFQKAASCIVALRHVSCSHRRSAHEEVVGHFVGDSVLPYYLALLQATLRTIRYQESNPAQKTFAFLAAGRLCERISQLVT